MTRHDPLISPPPIGARILWHLECWGLKRIDAWGGSFIVGTLALVSHHALTLKTALLLAAITANYWLGFWVNDYFDASYDRSDENKARLNLFVQRPAYGRRVRLVSGLIVAISAVFLSVFGLRGWMVLLVSFLAMWAYSAPPLRLKSRPGLDLLIHALFVLTWPYLICIWLIDAAWTQQDYFLLSICFLISLNSQLNQQIRDYDVDSRTDVNFTTRVGLARTIVILKVSASALVFLFLLAVARGNIPWLFAPLGLAGGPISAHQILHTLQNSGRAFPRRLVYIIMLLMLIYIGVVMALEVGFHA